VDFETIATAQDESFMGDDTPASDKWTNDIHRRFGHIHIRGLRGLHKVVSDLSALIPVDRLDRECDTCTLAKQLRVVNGQPLEKATEPLERVFGDYWGSYSIPTLFGERGFYSLID
jgi:hypothetical protein